MLSLRLEESVHKYHANDGADGQLDGRQHGSGGQGDLGNRVYLVRGLIHELRATIDVEKDTHSDIIIKPVRYLYSMLVSVRVEAVVETTIRASKER